LKAPGCTTCGYKIYNHDTVLATVTPDILQHTYSGITAASSYLISIASVSVIGESAMRSPATLIWAVETPTAPVIQVTGTTRDSCSFSWDPVSPPTVPAGAESALITGYVILIDDGLAGLFRVAYDGSTDPSKFTTAIYGLTAKTNYRITGYAVNKAGTGANAT
jgi:hypothetical protein